MSKWSPANLRAAHAADIFTLLSKETEIRGAVKTQNSIRVDGSVHGDLVSAKTVTIGSTGMVEGNIVGEDIIVAGRVKGTLTARGKVVLEGTAQIEGDIHTSRLSVTEGAMFRGQSSMGTPARPGVRLEAKTENGQPQKERVVAA